MGNPQHLRILYAKLARRAQKLASSPACQAAKLTNKSKLYLGSRTATRIGNNQAKVPFMYRYTVLGGLSHAVFHLTYNDR